jgi:DNA-binding NtrC family response regulator
MSNKHILFVDDEVPIRETLSLYFRRKGFLVTTAENAEEARLAVKANKFSLVILDVNLGGDNGLELLEFFKQMDPPLPVIMFTSLGYDPVLLKETMARGADAFMSKAESLDNLFKEVQRVTPVAT